MASSSPQKKRKIEKPKIDWKKLKTIIGAKNVKLLQDGAKKDADDSFELDLSNKNLTAADCKLLAPAIAQLGNYDYDDGAENYGGCYDLNLSHNKIGDEGCKNLESVLKRFKGLNSRCKRINLRSNNITAEGCKYIAVPSYEHEHGTLMLNMSDNKIGDIGVNCLIENDGDKITECESLRLILNNVDLTDEGMKCFKTLEMYERGEGDDERCFEVANNKLTDKSTKILKKMITDDNLSFPMNISGNQFSEEATKKIRKRWIDYNEFEHDVNEHFKCDYEFEDDDEVDIEESSEEENSEDEEIE